MLEQLTLMSTKTHGSQKDNISLSPVRLVDFTSIANFPFLKNRPYIAWGVSFHSNHMKHQWKSFECGLADSPCGFVQLIPNVDLCVG